MDRNSIVGIVLIAVVIIVFGIVTRPSKVELQERQRISDSLFQAEQQRIREEAARAVNMDSLQRITPQTIPDERTPSQELETVDLTDIYGAFTSAARGEEEFYTIENDLIKLKLSTLGGRIYSAELKNYKTWDAQPLLLFDGDSTNFGLNFFAQNKLISTNDLYFKPTTNNTNIVIDQSPGSIGMRLNAEGNSYIEYLYFLEPGSYKVGFKINMVEMDRIMGRTNSMDLDWKIKLRKQEKGRTWEDNYSTIYYKYFEGDVERMRGPRSAKSKSTGPDTKDLTTRLKWIGFKQQFFSSVLIADNYFSRAVVESEKITYTDDYLKRYGARITIPFSGESNQNIPMHFYFGPNHFKTLKTYGEDLSELVDLGWKFISWINKWFVITIFNFLEKHIASYGLIIFLLTIFFKGLLFPLTLKSYKSTAKMRVLKPEIDELNKKYGKDKAMEKQKATMALYKKAGVNPMGGCLPTLLQMPVFLALFRFFPASIELRQKSFLWANDLSAFDSIVDLPFNIPMYGDHISLFTLLMGASMLITTKMNSGQMETSGSMPGMKVMMYIMPVMMLLWFNSYASGLSYYYFVSNVFTFGQMMLAKRFINEEEILKKLHEHKKKPVKKSKFQARLEEMQKQQKKKR